MPNRNASTDSYRYGFNGKEKDDEVKGEGNSYDFGARMYDNRIGRWFASDPLQKEYEYLSPYSYTGGNPILYIELDGEKFINPYKEKLKNAKKELATQKKIYDALVLKNGGNLKAKDVKNYYKNNLKPLEKSVENFQKQNDLVEGLLYTLELLDKTTFDELNTYVDGDGQDIDITITLSKFNESPITKGTSMEIFAETKGLTKPKVRRTVNQVTGATENAEVIGVQGNNIEIILYEKSLAKFGNEIGDIKYFKTFVKDSKSFYKFKKTGDGRKSPGNKDKTGAFLFSLNYELELGKKIKEYKKKNKIKPKDKIRTNILKNK